jgi:hypothetical protein
MRNVGDVNAGFKAPLANPPLRGKDAAWRVAIRASDLI